MLLVVPMLLAIALAVLQGGSLRYLAQLPIRGAGFIVASLTMQLLLYAPGVRDSASIVHSGGAIYVCALGLVLVGALSNWRLGTAVRIAVAGLALNTAVILANGGHMPVNAEAMSNVQGSGKVQEIAGNNLYGNTTLANSSSRLAPLGDVLPVRLPGGHGNVYSLGDTMITFGIAAAAYGATRRPCRTPRSSCGIDETPISTDDALAVRE